MSDMAQILAALSDLHDSNREIRAHVAGSHTVLNTRLDEFNARLDEFNARLDEFNSRRDGEVRGLREDANKTKFEIMDALGRLQKGFAQLQDEITVNFARSEVVDRRSTHLNERLNGVESVVQGLSQELVAVEKLVRNLHSAVSDLQSRI